jgi:glyoxylase-like metal-dependent hydrolase (beta-lactamase superfamily II)
VDTPAALPVCLSVGPIETNCYIAYAGDGVVVIDPGGNPERIMTNLKRVGDPKVVAVLLTHGHFDHTASAEELSRMVGAPIFAHAAEAELLAGSHSFFGMKPPAVPATLFEGETLPIPIDGLTVLHTPGHSPGSVVYVTAVGAFVGDLIFQGSVGRVDLAGGDEATLLRSIRRVLDVVPRDLPLYPGHGPDTTLGDELMDNPWVQEAASL